MDGPLDYANTFIYYKDSAFGLKPKYEKNRVLKEYTKDDEIQKRYKYFLYQKVEMK
jgi:hypothetical protein